MIKGHILTGDDCMSNMGTKHAAMASDPVQYLANFEEADTLTEQDAAKTFDDFRIEIYTRGSSGIDALPSTSSGIRGHIQRGAFLVHTTCHLLATLAHPCHQNV